MIEAECEGDTRVEKVVVRLASSDGFGAEENEVMIDNDSEAVKHKDPEEDDDCVLLIVSLDVPCIAADAVCLLTLPDGDELIQVL